ncbi:MAG: cysteine hydrolase [Synergistetes bacterium]|nr:cysteine hydrolase [Synergistota bacterium]MCX8128132.1 cysteine hydrolase [Synergistota bacterium]MDW8192508.1 isochorismatase family cysteine hydrolase [Synergistota bacterium]
MKALFVIDMLNDFVNPAGKLYIGESGRRIVPFIKERVHEFRKEGKVFYICDAHSEDDKEFKDWPPHASKGSWGAKVIDEIAPQPEDILVEKKTYDGFIETQLKDILEKEKINEIYVVGVLTNICVLYTSAHAKMLGYPVKVYKDGCASITEEKHKWALKEMSESLKIEIL